MAFPSLSGLLLRLNILSGKSHYQEIIGELFRNSSELKKKFFENFLIFTSATQLGELKVGMGMYCGKYKKL